MNVKSTLNIITLLCSFFIFGTAQSTHLVGGSLSYKYLGSVGSFDRYQVTLYVYRDCASRGGSGGGAVEFDDEITLCIFENLGNVSSRRRNIGDVKMDRLYDRPVDPVGNTDCPDLASACLRQAKYSETITVPKSNFGYILKWERCCRNTQNNLSQNGGGPDQGQTYTGVIPPSALKNSSPEFTEVPVPFICVNDTATLRNFAVDPDGDSLSYQFVTPYQGASTATAITDICEAFMNPYKNVKYKTGFNAITPFGTGGVATINPVNGLTTYLSKATGRYAVAVEVTEWRAGQAISKIRLDLQILVINCKPNKKPTLSSNAGTTDRWDIEAGENFCIDVTGADADLDQNISLKAFGDIFTGANNHKGTRASFNPNPATGFRRATGKFCWNTDCDQARLEPYLVTFEVVDDGCPAKFINKNIEIYINPFDPKDAPTGPTRLCQNSTGNVYSVLFPTPNASYRWEVLNGTIVGSDSGNTATIAWDDNSTFGRVNLTTFSEFGCEGTPKELIVQLVPAPNKPIISGKDTVCLNAASTFTATADAGTNYTWNVTGGLATAGGSATDNFIDVTWNTKGNQFVALFVTNALGCSSTIDTHNVYVSFPDSFEILGPPSICPNNINIDYFIKSPISTSTYEWFVTGGTKSSSGTGASSIKVDWGEKGLGTLRAIETNKFGCKGNPIQIEVIKDYILAGQFPKGDTILCENELSVPYDILNVNGEQYDWNILGNGTITSGQNTNKVMVDWGAASIAKIGVKTTAFDPVNNRPCSSSLKEIIVDLKPYPKAKPIVGDLELCQQKSLGDYSVTGFTNSQFQWEVINLDFVGQGLDKINIDQDTFGTFTLRVQETSEFGCKGPWNDTILIIHPKPRTSPIIGTDIVCFPNYDNHSYAVTGFANSVFNWSVVNGAFFGASNGSAVTVDWGPEPNGSVSVTETSEFGCIGDPIAINVFKDDPRIDAENVTVDPPPNADKDIIFSFALLNAPRYNNSIIVQRKIRSAAGAYISVDAINPNLTSYTDQTASTDEYSYTYRAAAVNLCGDSVFSNEMTDILLTGKKPSPFESEITFTDFTGWDNGVEKYELYRALENKSGYSLYKTYSNPQIDLFNNGTEHYGQLYRIKAYERGGNRISWSNDIIFYFEPVIFVPNAFSPTKDNLNEIFKPSNSGLKKYKLTILNRWGEKLFETENPQKGWNGLYLEKEVPGGVYVYYVQYEDFRDKKYSTKGTVHLLR